MRRCGCGVGVFAIFEELGRIAANDGPGGDISDGDGTGGDDGAGMDGDAGRDEGAGAYPGFGFDVNRWRDERE